MAKQPKKDETGKAGPTPPKCPITREQFAKFAKPIPVDVDLGDGVKNRDIAGPKLFDSGTLGWFCNGKINVTIDGVPVKAQLQVQIFVVGSKELPRE